jgi:hypothetical protein
MQDTQSRLEMLGNYRKELLALQTKAATNDQRGCGNQDRIGIVDGAEQFGTCSGEAAFQTKRVTTDIVTINFAVAEQRAFWRPVREAFRDFLGNLSNGVSQAITAVAYIMPWLFVVVPGLYLVRFLWRRRGW